MLPTEIGSGIKVYFSNDSEKSNFVILPDGGICYYDDGELLLGLTTDKAMSLMIEAPGNMIKNFPGRDMLTAVETITVAFRWLHDAVVDEEQPVVTEMFRSMFSEVVHDLAGIASSYSAFPTIGEFLDACYAEYTERVIIFAALFDAIAAEASGMADELQKQMADQFWSDTEELYELYKHKCHVRTRNGKTTVETYQVTSLLQLMTMEVCRLKRIGKLIKICTYCGGFFIPEKRADTKYCKGPAPGHPDKTCAEIGPQVVYANQLRCDPRKREHRSTRGKFHSAAKRARDNGDDNLLRYCELQLQKEYQKYAAETATEGTEEV